MKNEIRLIACDIDGTLLNSAGEVPCENIIAINKALESGIYLAFCSGRFAYDIELIANNLGLKKYYIIALNGCDGVIMPSANNFINSYLTYDSFKNCAEIFNKYRINYSCFFKNILCTSDSENKNYHFKTWVPDMDKLPNIKFYAGYEYILKYAEIGFNKIGLFDFDIKKLNNIKMDLSLVPGIEITSSGKNNIEIMPKGISKVYALNKLVNILNITSNNIMAIGDNYNDLTMLSYAKYSVAMGNAETYIKNHAKYISDTNDNAGVAKIINKLIFNE